MYANFLKIQKWSRSSPGGYGTHEDNHNNIKTTLDDVCLRWESVRPITPTRPLLPCYHVVIISLCRCNFHLHNYYYHTWDGMNWIDQIQKVFISLHFPLNMRPHILSWLRSRNCFGDGRLFGEVIISHKY